MKRKVTAIAVLCTFLLAVIPPATYAQQQSNNVQLPPGCPPNCTSGSQYHAPYAPPIKGLASPSTFSTSVANGVSSTSVTAQNHYKTSGRFQSSDYTAMATSLQTFFNEENSTGFTASFQTWILNNKALFTTNPTLAQVEAAYSALNTSGEAVAIPESTFVNNILDTSLTIRSEFYSYVQADGLEYIHSQIIATLRTLATEALNSQHGGVFVLADCQIPWVSIGAAYLGIAALAISGPVGWAIGAAAAFGGLGGLGFGC